MRKKPPPMRTGIPTSSGMTSTGIFSSYPFRWGTNATCPNDLQNLSKINRLRRRRRAERTRGPRVPRGRRDTGESPMKRHVLIGATALAVVLGGQAFAQSVAVEIAPDQRTRIKEYVIKEKVKPVTVKERISV